MKVAQWSTDKPIPYARNPRINDASVSVVAASIQEFGFRQPIVVDDDGVILVGHTRLKAAQQLGIKTVPVHVATGLTESQRKAYRIMDNRAGHWQGDRTQTTLWEIDKPAKSETGHSTQKPLECMAKPIENNSKVGDSIYEPFSGSGTTIIACENLNRKCRAIEISPAYVAIALQRWSDHTGLTPELVCD